MLAVRRVAGASSGLSLLRPRAVLAAPSPAPMLLGARTMVQIAGVEVTPRRAMYAGIGLLGGYAVWRVFYYITASYLEMTVFDVGEIGFFTGVAFSASVVGGVLLLRRYGTPHPDSMTPLVLRRLRQDALVQRKLGLPLELGEFKAYAYKGGLSWRGYTPRRLQMIVQVRGPKDSGVLSLDVARKWRAGLVFKSLCLDVASTNERVLYAGSSEDVIFKGSIKLLQ